MAAADELTNEEIAAELDVDRTTFARWKKHPDFVAKVEALAGELGDAVRRYAIGRKLRRVKDYDDRRGRMLQVITERAADPAMQEAAGGKTGLMVRTVKSIGGGENAREVEEYAVDTGLLKELRELERQAAQELGQWAERHELSGKDGGPIEMNHDVDHLRKLPLDELVRIYHQSLGPPEAGRGKSSAHGS